MPGERALETWASLSVGRPPPIMRTRTVLAGSPPTAKCRTISSTGRSSDRYHNLLNPLGLGDGALVPRLLGIGRSSVTRRRSAAFPG
jgi:hypothetical protein